MNEQHVETFQEDISFTSDLTVSHDEPQSQEEFKGTIVCLFMNLL